MAYITYAPGIDTVSGAMAKPAKNSGHIHGNYVIGTGIDTFLGINPYTAGSETVEGILKGSVTEMCGAIVAEGCRRDGFPLGPASFSGQSSAIYRFYNLL